MALWNGSLINSNETAMVFNQLANLQAIPIIRKKNALLYMFLGKLEANSLKNGVAKFQRSDKITGKNVEVKLLGSLPSTTKVTDGSSELASVTPAYDANAWGAAEFVLAHYTLTQGIPSSELNRFKGKEAKTANYLQDVLKRMMLGYENDIGTDLHSTTATNVMSRTVPGSWLQAISDGGGDSGSGASAGGPTSGETANGYRYYGTIDRQDSANADFRGLVFPSTGSLSLGKIRKATNMADGNGGTTDLSVSGTNIYTNIQMLLESYTIITDAEDMVDFGGKYCRYDGITHMHDQRCPAGYLGGLDSETWKFIDNHDDFTDSGVVKDFTKNAGYVVNTERWVGTICEKPNSNWKMAGVTAASY